MALRALNRLYQSERPAASSPNVSNLGPSPRPA